MANDETRVALAAALCTALGAAGFFTTAGVARPTDPPAPETLTKEQAEEAAREAEAEVNAVENLRENNPAFENMREAAEGRSEEREEESRERESEASASN